MDVIPSINCVITLPDFLTNKKIRFLARLNTNCMIANRPFKVLFKLSIIFSFGFNAANKLLIPLINELIFCVTLLKNSSTFSEFMPFKNPTIFSFKLVANLSNSSIIGVKLFLIELRTGIRALKISFKLLFLIV